MSTPSANTHAMATGHIPGYLPGADGSDPLFAGMVVFTILLVLLIGAFYFKLHAIPEHMAHEDNHTQMQVIGILALLALFTHNNIFWVVALLLAAFRMPDFLTPIQSIANSLDALNRSEQEAIKLESEKFAAEQRPSSLLEPAPEQTQDQTRGETNA